MDPYKALNISVNPDGTLTRHPTFPDSHSPLTPTSRDVPLNPTNNTSIRIFIPSPPPSTKLPVILYFHGGGFVLYRSSSLIFHRSCAQLSSSLPALVLSVDYRLAPEHRLPAAYQDSLDALLWLRDQARGTSPSPDPWLRDHADFSRCFLMGSSSGANIAYRLGLQALDHDIQPVRIRGLIFNQAFFGGEEATESELRMENDRIVPLAVSRLLWELALPVGASRDHEYCNPMAAAATTTGLARCLVRGYVGDPLIDRQRAFARLLEREGVRVVGSLEEEGFHGVEVFDPKKAEELVAAVKSFVYVYDDDCAAATVGKHRL